MKVRKKPVVVDGVFEYRSEHDHAPGVCFCEASSRPHLHTIHKGQTVDLEVGDLIFPELDGEHYYPVKPETFEKTYEVVREDQDV